MRSSASTSPALVLAGLAVCCGAALGGCTVNLGVPSVDPVGTTESKRTPTTNPSPTTQPPDPEPAASQAPASKPTRPPTTPERSEPKATKPRLDLDRGTAPNPDLPWIVEGDRGDGARCVQHALNIIDDAQVPVDGYYGPVSRRALEAFQRSVGIRADGEVGPATGRWLVTYYDAVRGTGAWARTGCYDHVPVRPT